MLPPDSKPEASPAKSCHGQMRYPMRSKHLFFFQASRKVAHEGVASMDHVSLAMRSTYWSGLSKCDSSTLHSFHHAPHVFPDWKTSPRYIPFSLVGSRVVLSAGVTQNQANLVLESRSYHQQQGSSICGYASAWPHKTCSQVGFRSCTDLGVPGAGVGGFASRSIYVLVK